MEHLAQIKNKFLNPSIQDKTGSEFLSSLLSLFVTLGLVIGGVYFLFMLIIGGISWIGSGGDKAAAESARARITHAAIGLVVLFSVFAVVAVVQNLFQINILNIDIDRLKIQ